MLGLFCKVRLVQDKEAEPNPHLHVHVRPRYKNVVEINNHSYMDSEFAHHYALRKEILLTNEDREVLYELMKKHFSQQRGVESAYDKMKLDIYVRKLRIYPKKGLFA